MRRVRTRLILLLLTGCGPSQPANDAVAVELSASPPAVLAPQGIAPPAETSPRAAPIPSGSGLAADPVFPTPVTPAGDGCAALEACCNTLMRDSAARSDCIDLASIAHDLNDQKGCALGRSQFCK
jgi:hypothetical protein